MKGPARDPGLLPQLLHEQIACTRELARTLAAEKTALLQQEPPETLDCLVAAKSAAVDTLRRLGEPLRRLGGRHPDEVEAALAGLPDPAQGRALWRELRELAAQCQRANHENAALLEARHRQVRDSLRRLRGEQAPQTYVAGGYAAAKLASHRLGSA